MKTFAILIAALVGVAAAALFRRPTPSMPFQVPRGGAVTTNVEPQLSNFAFIDPALDNAKIEADGNIDAARKCGFCMGVS
jgi:hypothetical protein